MHSTDTRGRRLALLPVEERATPGRPVIRRYRLARVIDDLGSAVAAPRVPATQGAPATGVRAP
jgi:hypothetical protein